MCHKVGLMLLTIIMLDAVMALPTGEGVVNSDFEGKSLFAMGKIINNPLLKLLGKTIEKLENDTAKNIESVIVENICKLHVCTEWIAWSNCSASVSGTYGVQTRSRTCGINGANLCANRTKSQDETDSRVCEGEWCPYNYTLSKRGFCFGMIRIDMNFTKAHEACKQDGGHLVNIDSEMKAVELNSVLEQRSLTNYYFIIDGRRTLPNGKWQHEYSTHDSGYTNWISGEPATTDDCKEYSKRSGVWIWVGIPCSQTWYPICEILQV